MNNISLESTLILNRALGTFGEKGVLAKFIQKMKETLNLAWGAAVKKTIEISTKIMAKENSSDAGLKILLERLRRDLAQVADEKTTDRLIGMVNGSYQVLKRMSAKDLEVKYSFSALDKRAVNSLGRENTFWINDLYSTHLSRRISDVGQKIVIEQGLGPIEGAKVMKKALKKELALEGGSLPLKDVVPARYAGNVDEYTRILTSNVANRARNYSRMSSLVDGKIERYRITAVLDKRTSEICRFMNGKVFTVAQGVSQMESMIGAKPENIKKVSPWLNINDLDRIGKGSNDLAESGQALPPYHGRCRTLIEAA